MKSGNHEDHHVSEGPINTDRDQLGEETNPMPGPLVTASSRPTEAPPRHVEHPVTTPSRFGRGPIHRYFAAKVVSTMLTVRLPGKTRLWAAIGLMFIVALFGAAPVSLGAPSDAHVEHHVTETGDLDHLAAVDHSHLGPAAIQSAPEMFADSLLHRVRVALPVLGLIFAGGVLWLWSPQHTVAVGRGPPRGPLIISPGRDVLARLCVLRR